MNASIVHYAVAALLLLAGATPVGASGWLEPYQGDPTGAAIALPDLEGRPHSLAEYRGKVVLVNFWGTWCPPCVRELPSMQRLRETMRDRPFAILAVNVMQQKGHVAHFLKRFDVDFTVLLDGSGNIARAWKIRVYPTSYLLDPEGQIRYVALGPLDWDGDEPRQVIETLMPGEKLATELTVAIALGAPPPCR